MALSFKIKPKETKNIELDNKKYQISCNFFKEHNHKNKPLYYYHDKIKEDDLVVTIEEENCEPYDSPYSSTVNTVWNVCRKTHAFNFIKKEDSSINVEIEKNNEDLSTS